jgi:hypothetical protein
MRSVDAARHMQNYVRLCTQKQFAWSRTTLPISALACSLLIGVFIYNDVAHSDPPKLSQEDRERLVKSLESWYFEPLNMPEHELLACVLFLFQVLFRIEGMKDAIKIDMGKSASWHNIVPTPRSPFISRFHLDLLSPIQTASKTQSNFPLSCSDVIPRFILHIRQLYRWQNHYHNFEHAVDVLQAIHCYLHSAGMVPRVSLLLVDADAPGGMWSSTRPHDSGQLVTCLTPLEIFALYLTAIGHDIGHPGFNNPFMVSSFPHSAFMVVAVTRILMMNCI